MKISVIFAVLISFSLLNYGTSCDGHGHGHSHEDHGHTHGGHGHQHGGHGHQHGGHGHQHGGHGHDHGSHGHEHNHFEDEDVLEQQRNPSFKYSKEANVKVKDVPVKKPEEKPTTIKKDIEKIEFNLWLTALGSTVLISLAPVVILFLIPLDKGPAHENLLKTLLSFASGGLLGDAFLHLIPHALMAHEPNSKDSHHHGHSHSDGGSHSHDMGVGLWILTGIVTFLAVEKVVRLFKHDGHGHSHAPVVTEKKKSEQHGDSKKDDDIPKEKLKKLEKASNIKVAAYLNLAADFTHNFTDGLAIGASYLVSRNVGLITTVTILLHEVPHEIGDFAILIQAGHTKKKAMLLQLTTAVGAMAGTVCSLLAEGAGELATSWILPFTAGGFIYIATVAVIPELLGEAKIGQSIKEIFAMLVGILMMVFIAQIE